MEAEMQALDENMPLFDEVLNQSLNLDYVNWAKAVFLKFTNLNWMIAIQNFYGTCFTIFYPTASATVYGRRPKFFRAEHLATAEGPTLGLWYD